MPIYEYECGSCRVVLEIFQRMSEEPITSCPECAGPVKKLVSMSSFQLRGGGWYADGYNSTSTDAPATAAAEPSAKTPAEKPEKAAGGKSGSPAAAKSTDKSVAGCGATT